MVIFHSYVSLPEGIPSNSPISSGQHTEATRSHTKPGHWFSLDHRGPSTAPVTGQIHGEVPTDTWFAGKSTKEIEVEWGLLWMS